MNTSEHALVSICIPTYKGASFLAATIESVLSQSYSNFELWIIDDQSPDETAAIVAGYHDPRLHYSRNALNLGPEGNWNRCLELATGKYFKLLPHDDLLAPTCLQEQVAVLESDPAKKLALVFGYRAIINPAGRILMKRGLPAVENGPVNNRTLVRRCVKAGTNLIGEPGNGLFRSELIKQIGLYDATYPYLVDLDYWFRILKHGNAYYTATHSSSFRLSKGSWSVALGNKQLTDFKGFVEKFMSERQFGISTCDRWLGFARARFNMLARALIYRFVL